MAPGDPETGNIQKIKAVETSIHIIDTLDERGEAGVTEIANHTGLSKGTVYKHLQTLLPSGMIVRSGNRYRIGLRFLEIGSNRRRRTPARLFIRPKMKELAKKTGLLVQFCVEQNNHSILLYRESTDCSVETRMRIGRQIPLHQTATGKAIFATFPDERIENVIDSFGLENVTSQTITDRGQIIEELATVRKRGYAINREESSKGLRAIAAPIVDDGDQLIGALGIGGPLHQIKDDEFETEIPNLLLSTTDEIELNIAYSDIGVVEGAKANTSNN